MLIFMENSLGTRLMFARKMAGMSLQDLSQALGHVLTRQALHKYEQGKMKPDSSTLIALANALKVSVDFFFSDFGQDIQLTNISYRKYSSRVSKTDRIAIEAKAREVFERYFALERLLNFGEKAEYFKYSGIIHSIEDAEKAAISLRKEWNLGYDPIPDVVEMLEDKGYKVVEIDAPEGFDGLKAEINGIKVIVLKKAKSVGEDVVRKRFTALHELAHHALKFSESLSEKEEELICHAFASAVLYPAEMAVKDLHQNRSHFYQNELVLIKERWGISFPAIFARARQLKVINDSTYKFANIRYRERKLHLNEPGQFQSKEKPVRFEQLVYLGLSKEILSVNDAAFYLGLSVIEFRSKLHLLL